MPSTSGTGPRSWWLSGLVSVLGALDVLMATSAGSATVMAVGVVGGAALMVAPWLAVRARGWSLVLLLVGTIPFAAVAWAALVPLLVAVAAVAIGVPLATRRR